MVLNELSLATLDDASAQEIKKQISVFLKVCHELADREDKSFYYTKELLTEPLCANYGIHDWLKDDTVERREKSFFRTLLNRGILLDSEQLLESEFLIRINSQNKGAIGCLAAYEWNGYVVSFLSDVLWDGEFIQGEYIHIDGTECSASIRNCSKVEHVEKLITEKRIQGRLMISSGRELWDKREELFPHLIFCDSVKRQLEEARISLHIKVIVNRIQILEDYFSTYEGTFEREKMGYGCRYESETVQNDVSLRNLRKFTTPYGEEKYFYWHISFSGDYPGRIHFLPDSKHKLGIIGYVGKHLPTKTYRTI